MTVTAEATEQATGSLEPIAIVNGEDYTSVPEDLYIPPDALEVILESFEGPLDLLLYLIRHQNLDILNIPIAKITAQYMVYLKLMSALRLDLAAEYMVMAAVLAEIKSRLLLPKPPSDDSEEETDPRAELIKRLQAYEQIKTAAENLDEVSRSDRDFWSVSSYFDQTQIPESLPDVRIEDLFAAMMNIMGRIDERQAHMITREPLSVRHRMTGILGKLNGNPKQFLQITDFFDATEGRQGLVVSFLAILEMTKDGLASLSQSQPFSPIYIKLQTSATEDNDDNQ
jgi:segregation and condensation protein A